MFFLLWLFVKICCRRNGVHRYRRTAHEMRGRSFDKPHRCLEDGAVNKVAGILGRGFPVTLTLQALVGIAEDFGASSECQEKKSEVRSSTRVGVYV